MLLFLAPSKFVGLLPELEATGSHPAFMALGYWIHCPVLLALLADPLRDDILEGELTSLTFDAGLATAEVQIGEEVLRVTSRFVFGCGDAKSTVRAKLQAMSDECMADFEPRVLDTPSFGLVYRAVLATPLDEFHPHEMHVIAGKSGQWIVMLPFSGARGKRRPLSFVWRADNILHNLVAPETVYAHLDEELPQLEARNSCRLTQRRLGVRRQACGNCRGRSGSLSGITQIVTSAVRVDVALTFVKDALPLCFHQVCIRVERWSF